MKLVKKLQKMSESERLNVLDDLLGEAYHAIIETDQFESAAGRTSATDCGVEEHEIADVNFDGDQCVARFTFAASGEPPDDGCFDGDRIDGKGVLVIDQDGHISLDVLTTEVSDKYDWDGEEQDM